MVVERLTHFHLFGSPSPKVGTTWKKRDNIGEQKKMIDRKRNAQGKLDSSAPRTAFAKKHR